MGWRMAGFLACCLALLSLTACAPGSPSRQAAFFVTRTKAAVIPPVGMIYSRVKAPIVAGVSGKPVGPLVGRASANSIAIPPNPFGIPAVALFTWGDMSKQAAATNGGITNVTHADYEMTLVLMFFRRVTLVAYGQ